MHTDTVTNILLDDDAIDLSKVTLSNSSCDILSEITVIFDSCLEAYLVSIIFFFVRSSSILEKMTFPSLPSVVFYTIKQKVYHTQTGIVECTRLQLPTFF